MKQGWGSVIDAIQILSTALRRGTKKKRKNLESGLFKEQRRVTSVVLVNSPGHRHMVAPSLRWPARFSSLHLYCTLSGTN